MGRAEGKIVSLGEYWLMEGWMAGESSVRGEEKKVSSWSSLRGMASLLASE